MTLPVLALGGPTASGKSALALHVARRLGAAGAPAEIVNADSMLVYRGMDIGTAKPSVAERAEIPHHVIDILDVTQTATVADFQRLARAAIADCRARGVVPIVTGGSALYLRAILDHFEFPGTDAEVRARWEGELADRGPAALHAHLRRVAPQAAASIQPENGRRLVRALEVLELTGDFSPTLPSWSYALEGVTQWGLSVDRAVLDARIAARVDRMWAGGLVAEVRSLVEQGLAQGRTASRALGYRQVLDHLRGGCTEEEAREATIARTRRFARRQLSWLRRDPRIVWRPAGEDTVAGEIVASALRR